MSDAPKIEIRLLGGLEVRADGVPVDAPDGARPRDLLVYLALHRDREIPRHELADVFWPDSTEAQGRTNVRNLLHRLRRSDWADRVLEVGPASIGVAPHVSVDVTDLEQIAALVADGELDDATERDALENAFALLRGELAPACRAEWVFEPRERLRRLAAEIADDLARILEDADDRRGAIRVLRQARGHDPSSETVHRRLIRLLRDDGDRAAALRAWHACVESLRDIGLRPSAATEELAAELRATPSNEEPATAQVAFVGRSAERELLDEALRDACEGAAHVINIRGEAGAGKTRLAEELMRSAKSDGVAVGIARYHPSGADRFYGAVDDWLRSDVIRTAAEALADDDISELSRVAPGLLQDRPDGSPRHAGASVAAQPLRCRAHARHTAAPRGAAALARRHSVVRRTDSGLAGDAPPRRECWRALAGHDGAHRHGKSWASHTGTSADQSDDAVGGVVDAARSLGLV